MSTQFNSISRISANPLFSLPNHAPWTMTASLPVIPPEHELTSNEARLQRQTLWNRFARVPEFTQLCEAQRLTLLVKIHLGSSKASDQTFTSPEDIYNVLVDNADMLADPTLN